MSSILVVTERYWPDGGGGELATHLIVDLLRKKFDITIVSGSKNVEVLPGVHYVYEPLLSKREKPILWLNSSRLVTTERFRELLRRHDIVYVPRFAFPVIPAAKKLGKRVIVHLHDYVPISYTAVVLAPFEQHMHRIARDDVVLECRRGLKHCASAVTLWWLPRLARRWISQADKIVCVSKRQAEIISDLAPELRDKIEVTYNPPPSQLLAGELRKELSDVPTFLYVGGDSYVKGFHLLLYAIKKLGERGLKAEFLLTNNYSLKSLQLLRKVLERKESVKVEVLGRVSYEKLVELHQKTWALLFPSIFEETYGYAVIESALLGTIAVASRVGAVEELLGDTAARNFMFAPQSGPEFVKAVTSVVSLGKREVERLGMSLRREISQKLSLAELGVMRAFSEI